MPFPAQPPQETRRIRGTRVSAPYRLRYQQRSVAVLGRGAREIGLAVLDLVAAALLNTVPVRALGLLFLGLPRFVRRRLVALLDVVGVGLGVFGLLGHLSLGGGGVGILRVTLLGESQRSKRRDSRNRRNGQKLPLP